MTIFVGNLCFAVSAEDIGEFFAKYGSVKRVQLPTNEGLISGSVGYITMKTEIFIDFGC